MHAQSSPSSLLLSLLLLSQNNGLLLFPCFLLLLLLLIIIINSLVSSLFIVCVRSVRCSVCICLFILTRCEDLDVYLKELYTRRGEWTPELKRAVATLLQSGEEEVRSHVAQADRSVSVVGLNGMMGIGVARRGRVMETKGTTIHDSGVFAVSLVVRAHHQALPPSCVFIHFICMPDFR